ncbi:glycine zipper 2TM domain-containing protein [Marinihelvus fidelis]|uniref:Glycine zipper 2TM domain-containing protein n=1 Tax=Marinihelvus fidelis TaxID=2613842 RepID=A0A5N0TGM6_9GAMM|nr:glycine zipper 2TM domain-containing protein [Marinihelvus fidelis]KAA9134210.1 glycine zipper 2TM domain-containing protein [Marinihelvus fidelis]
MNRQTLTGVMIGAVAVTAIGTFAGVQLNQDPAFAEVIDVEPIYTTESVPREACREELETRQKPVKDKHQVTGTVAGAVIGGLLGNQVGDGSGQDIATAAGAVAGGYAGNKAQEKIQENNTEQVPKTVCETRYDTYQEQAGFMVTYELDGERHRIRMDEDPGRRIPVEDGELRI